jgi:aspartate/methionine/tyrosine aminotransferase
VCVISRASCHAAVLARHADIALGPLKARARSAGQDVIDLGMGNPDLPTAPHIVAKLAEAAANPRAHGYSASRGIPGLRKAQAAYYARRFGVELDPENEIIVTLGSKEGLANLAQAITSPGDIVLVPNPAIPSIATASSSPAARCATFPCQAARRWKSSCWRSSARCGTRCPSRSPWC